MFEKTIETAQDGAKAEGGVAAAAGAETAKVAPQTPVPTAPLPGRMYVDHVVLSSGTGRDFVVPGRSRPELFSARLMDGSNTLEVMDLTQNRYWPFNVLPLERQTEQQRREIQFLETAYQAGGKPQDLRIILGCSSVWGKLDERPLI
jgi:hypothetical protein